MLAYPEIDPVALELGPLQIHWYGLAYVAGLSFAWWFGLQRTRQSDAPVQAGQVEDLIFYAAIGVILGGRLGYVFFYGFESFLADPMWLFRVWEGGMAFHGGLLGVITAMAVFSHQREIRFGRLMDLVSVMTPLGLGLGRLGNFIGQELWGRPTDLPWGMIFPRDPLGLARHPSQLYQFILEGCLLLAILFLFSRKQRDLSPDMQAFNCCPLYAKKARDLVERIQHL